MELVSPAGNLEKLTYAYLYGADAAYIGIKNFSLRQKADNFHGEEYESIRSIKREKKLYCALNIYFHNRDIRNLEEQIEYLGNYPFDAFIVSDIGAAAVLKRFFPSKPLHLSTQANCLNSEAAKYYSDMGFSRIILGRETSLREIAEIRKAVPHVQLEVFVHGAMCLAYAGRCFLSAWMAGRSANSGDCSHSCRWDYRVLEEAERPGEYYPIVEGNGFTTILSSKDLCMFDHVRDLGEAGVDALKIEGRMKSLYYTAVVTRAYRKALEAFEGKPVPELAEYRQDLFRVSHREFSTGFYFSNDEEVKPTESSYIREYSFLGTIGEQVENGIFSLNVKNQILEGDILEFIGPDLPYVRDDRFQLFDGSLLPVRKLDHGKPGFIRASVPLRHGYIIRKKVQ